MKAMRVLHVTQQERVMDPLTMTTLASR